MLCEVCLRFSRIFPLNSATRHEITRDRHEITPIYKSANAFALLFDMIQRY